MGKKIEIPCQIFNEFLQHYEQSIRGTHGHSPEDVKKLSKLVPHLLEWGKKCGVANSDPTVINLRERVEGWRELLAE